MLYYHLNTHNMSNHQLHNTTKTNLKNKIQKEKKIIYSCLYLQQICSLQLI